MYEPMPKAVFQMRAHVLAHEMFLVVEGLIIARPRQATGCCLGWTAGVKLSLSRASCPAMLWLNGPNPTAVSITISVTIIIVACLLFLTESVLRFTLQVVFQRVEQA